MGKLFRRNLRVAPGSSTNDMSTMRLIPQNGHSAAIAGLLVISIIVAATIARQRIDSEVHRTAPTAGTQAIERLPATPTSVRVAPVMQTDRMFRDRVGIHIDVQAMPRQLAAKRLASLTGSRILGDASLVAQARPLDLRWQGTDVATAWKQVLGSELRHSISCDGSGCAVRILSIEEVEGGTVLVPDVVTVAGAAASEPAAGLMNRPTDPDAIDESSLQP